MKKFLSLVLALIMAMSLVTISAGATEYKDLTDKDEIQYEEAVAVLNRIGVITGYDDGSFRPEGELTRGAAAKIIVSLLIGPDAANNLPNNFAPYPDVPAGHTFAGVISYCKTAGIISGYGDGTFKPANTLTGFAFAKMLLGAVGYDADLEKFVDTGWTMNVASVGQSAGLFDRLKFDGSAAVNREEACQLALNALKATVVQYSQGLNVNVTGDNTNVVVSGGQTRSYKTSNQEFAKNIRTRQGTSWSNGNLINNIATDYYTVEFAEEHFVDLRLEADEYNPTNDEFGRPSSEWSYKKVTIGTYPLEADFEFTTQMAHFEATDAAKERAIGLKNYDLEGNGYREDETVLWLNGVEIARGDAAYTDGNKNVSPLTKLSQICDLTDNGTLVQVYVSNTDADFITDVVVIQTQLMEIDRVASDYVSLKRVEPDTVGVKYGYNQPALHVEVENVRSDDEPFAVLSELKSGDKVAIVPVVSSASSRTGFKVAKAYVPETVSGKLTQVETYGNVGQGPNATTITVGGTKYNIANWNDKMIDLNADTIKITRKDVTLTLDEYGNALLAKDVGDTSEYMIVGSFGAVVENGKIAYTVEGWTVGGEAVSLSTGNVNWATNTNVVPGDLVKYTSNTTGSADWTLLRGNGADIYDVALKDAANNDLDIRARNVSVGLLDENTNGTIERYFADGVKFIYVEFDNAGEVDSIEFLSERQNVEPDELQAKNTNWSNVSDNLKHAAQAYTDNDYVKAVVIKAESNNAKLNNSGYIINYYGNGGIDSEGNKYQGYTVAYYNPDGRWVEDGVIYTDKTSLPIGSFFSYSKKEAPTEDAVYSQGDGYFDVRSYDRTTKNTSTALVNGMDVKYNTVDGKKKWSKDLFNVGPDFNPDYSMTSVNSSTRKTLVYADLDNGETIGAGEQLCHVIGGYDGYSVDGDSRLGSMRLASDVKWIDLRDSVRNNTGEERIDELADLTAEKFVPGSIRLAMLFNDNPSSDEFRTVYIIVVLGGTKVGDLSVAPTSVTISTPDGFNAADIDPAASYTFTANVEGGTAGATRNYSWKLGDETVGTNNSTVTLTGAQLLGKTLTVSVTCKESGKETSLAVSASNPVTVGEAQTPDSIEITSPDNLYVGEPAVYTPVVKDSSNNPITGNALAALNLKWGKVVDGTFQAFNAEEIASMGISVDEVTKELTIAHPENIPADTTISCQIQTAEGEDPIEPTTPPTVKEDNVIDNPNADSYQVTFKITDSNLIVENGSDQIRNNQTLTVDSGSVLKLKVNKFMESPNLLSVAVSNEEGLVMNAVPNYNTEFSVRVLGSGTITIGTEGPSLEAVAANFAKATLVDQAETGALSESALNDGYSMSSGVASGKIKLTFEHTGLYYHTNGLKTACWVIGFYANEETVDGWTLSNVSITNKKTSSDGNALNFGKYDGAYWLTIYQANAAAVTSDPMAMGDDGITTGTLTFTKDGKSVDISLDIDCSKVQVHQWSSERPSST